MKEVFFYKCEYCGELFESKEDCKAHESLHRAVIKANVMFRQGIPLGKINKEVHLWDDNMIKGFEGVTKFTSIKNKGSSKNASCKVIVRLLDDTVTFCKPKYPLVSSVEELVSTLDQTEVVNMIDDYTEFLYKKYGDDIWSAIPNDGKLSRKHKTKGR